MFLQSRIICFYAESALHAGSGTGLGAVDLPLQREVTTGYPIIQASGVKGALRSQARGLSEVNAVFGPADNPDHAGAFSPGDARILLFPVRALQGVFVWITSADVLARFQRDAQNIGYTNVLDYLPQVPKDQALVSDSGLLLDGQSIVLEEFSYPASVDESVQGWAHYLAQSVLPASESYAYWWERLVGSLVVLPPDEFRDFVRYSTEIVTRIKIDPETKTVAEGALFTQELLPADTVLYAPVHATTVRNRQSGLRAQDPETEALNVMNWVRDNVPMRIQIGGDETVGRGLVHLRWLEE